MTKTICVYCGSNPGARSDYRKGAEALGVAIAARGWSVVYGGASVGLMGTVADAALAGGAEVYGILPDALQKKELGHKGLTRLEVVSSMHERKQRMAELADAFIAMPGGAGTLEEIFEVWTWGQLGFHDKPCAFLNIADYYTDLVRFLDHQAAERFMRKEHRDMLIIDRNIDMLLERIDRYEAPVVEKWLKDKSQT